MKTSEITQYARALYDAHGDAAEAEAAKKAQEYEEAGDGDQAADWRKIREAIREIRGPRAT